jgi:hypothetical protein
MLETFLKTLHDAGYVRVEAKAHGKQYSHHPMFANKGRAEQRFAGHRILMEHTEALFNEQGRLEVIDAR